MKEESEAEKWASNISGQRDWCKAVEWGRLQGVDKAIEWAEEWLRSEENAGRIFNAFEMLAHLKQKRGK